MHMPYEPCAPCAQAAIIQKDVEIEDREASLKVATVHLGTTRHDHGAPRLAFWAGICGHPQL